LRLGNGLICDFHAALDDPDQKNHRHVLGVGNDLFSESYEFLIWEHDDSSENRLHLNFQNDGTRFSQQAKGFCGVANHPRLTQLHCYCLICDVTFSVFGQFFQDLN